MSTKQVRSRLFSQELISSFAYFAPQSFLAVYFLEVKNMPASLVAIALLTGSLTARAGRLLLFPLFDRLAPQVLLAGFQLIGALGYLWLALGESSLAMHVGLVMVGFFYGTNALMIRIINSYASKGNQQRLNYAIIHIGTNIASGLGPLLLNQLFLSYDPSLMFVLVSAFLACTSVYSWFFARIFFIPKQEPWHDSFKVCLSSPPVWSIIIVIVLGWFFYAQMFSMVPIVVSKMFSQPGSIWLVPFLNGASVVVLSFPLNRWLTRYTKSHEIAISLAFLLFAAGALILIIQFSLYMILAAVGLWSLAEMLFIPAYQYLISVAVDAQRRVAIFALSSLSIGVGEGLGQYFGVFWGNMLAHRGQDPKIIMSLLSGLALLSLAYVRLSRRFIRLDHVQE
jgi:DHA1 family multidrug resistance protein-like MFS transporter